MNTLMNSNPQQTGTVQELQKLNEEVDALRQRLQCVADAWCNAHAEFKIGDAVWYSANSSSRPIACVIRGHVLRTYDSGVSGVEINYTLQQIKKDGTPSNRWFGNDEFGIWAKIDDAVYISRRDGECS